MAPVAAFSQARVARASSVRCAPAKAVPHDKFMAATIGMSAAMLLSTSTPAVAGVTLEQPKLKKFIEEDIVEPVKEAKPLPDPAAALKAKAQKAASSVTSSTEKKPEAKKAEGASEPSEAFNVQALWPLGVVACGGFLFALTKVDPGFGDLVENAVKDSNTSGIGSEDVLKEAGGYAAAYYEEQGGKVSKQAPGAIKTKA